MGKILGDGGDPADDSVPQLPEESRPVQAWEEIEPGRYMPRRIIGSFRGGQLG